MSDTLVERPPAARFFCHRCNIFIEFEDILQDYTCPYCTSGFIEELDQEGDSSMISGDDVNDADMSNLDDSDETHQSASHPMLSDLAFLMSGGRVGRGAPRPESLLEQLVWTIRGGAGGSGAITAGTPFVLVGAPGDYVFGGDGLDAVVTQLLGQLDNTGPPPLPREYIAAIPKEDVTPEQAAANTTCSVCWEPFLKGEKVSRLECEHMFHSGCIEPWLQLHATCPICRRSLLPPAPPAPATVPGADGSLPPAAAAAPAADGAPPSACADPDAPATAPRSDGAQPRPMPAAAAAAVLQLQGPMLQLQRLLQHPQHPRLVRGIEVRRLRRRPPAPAWDSAATSSSSSSSSSVLAGRVWASPSDTSSSASLSSGADHDRLPPYNMDIDYD